MGQMIANVECHCGHVAKITDQDIVRRLGAGKRVAFRCTICGAAGQSRFTLGYDASVNPLVDQRREGD